MLAANDERFRRICRELLERPNGGYAELLRQGDVSSQEGVDVDGWRADIRRQARQDRIRVITSRDGARGFAMLNRRIPDERAMDAMRGALDRVVVLGEIRERSRLLGHELGSWLGHDDELISSCERCGARLYTRLGPERIEDGEALNQLCAEDQLSDL
ncbi:MAG: hypothetical protein ACLP8S_01725 [Solirubrobacteraceae bacterium]